MTRTKPCARCGGPKDRGLRGARYCAACRTDLEPIWRQTARERDLAKQRKRRREAGVPQRAKKFNADGQVWCARCSAYLPITRFRVNAKGKPAAYCKSCARAYNHEQRLKKVFGITADDYNRMLDVQEGRCAICRSKPNRTRLAVDHNHVTGKIRGLLCKRCNHDLLGSAQESVEILERAICYLESPPADTGLPVVIHDDFERGAIFIRRFGDKWAAVMEPDQFAALWREATRPEGASDGHR